MTNYRTQSWRGTEYPAPEPWELQTVESETVVWENGDLRACLFYLYQSGGHELQIDGETVFNRKFSTEEDLWNRVAQELSETGGG